MHLKPASKAVVLALAGGLFSVTALAQWHWIDRDGRAVYSDRSPPPEVLEKNIIKRPGGMRPTALPVSPVNAAAPAASAAPAAKASAPMLSGKDAQLEARKKQAEDAEAAKKKAEEDSLAAKRADNCDRARKGLVTVQSGVRMATTNAKGEREIMDDTARAAEAKRLQGVTDTDCK